MKAGPGAPLLALRSTSLPFWVLAVSYLVLCFLLVEPEWRPEWDSAIYLLTAEALSEGHGYTYLGRPFLLRPPGLSAVLTFFHSESGFSHVALNRAVALCAVLATLSLYALMRACCGVRFSASVALLFGTSSLAIGRLNWVLSEFPFLLLFFAGLAALEVASRPGRRSVLPVALGILALSLAVYVRSAALLAIPGLVLLGCWRARSIRGALPAVLVCVLASPWFLHSARAQAQLERPSEQLLLSSYTTALLHTDPGDPDSPYVDVSDVFARVKNNGRKLAGELSETVVGVRDPAVAALVLAMVGIGAYARRRKGYTAYDLFSVLYVALLLVYFTTHPRLLLPVLPLVYFNGLWGIRALASGAMPAGARTRGAFGITLIAALALLTLNAAQLRAAADAEQWRLGGTHRLGEVWDAQRRAAAWLRANTPRDAIAIARAAPILAYLADREVVTYRFARAPELFHRAGVEYAVVDGLDPSSFAALASERGELIHSLSGSSRVAPIRIFRISTPQRP